MLPWCWSSKMRFPFSLRGAKIYELFISASLCRKASIANVLAPKFSRRKRATRWAFKCFQKVVNAAKSVKLCAGLLDATVFLRWTPQRPVLFKKKMISPRSASRVIKKAVLGSVTVHSFAGLQYSLFRDVGGWEKLSMNTEKWEIKLNCRRFNGLTKLWDSFTLNGREP